MRKNVFQSSAVVAVAVGAADVDAFLVRHSEGVKNDEGVVEDGEFAARGDGLEVLCTRTADDIVRRDDARRLCVEASGRDCVSCSPSLVVFEDMMSLNSIDADVCSENSSCPETCKRLQLSSGYSVARYGDNGLLLYNLRCSSELRKTACTNGKTCTGSAAQLLWCCCCHFRVQAQFSELCEYGHVQVQPRSSRAGSRPSKTRPICRSTPKGVLGKRYPSST